MTDSRQLSLNVNMIIGLASILRPGLVKQVPPEQLRRMAIETLRHVRSERSVPQPFRDAFEGDER